MVLMKRMILMLVDWYPQEADLQWWEVACAPVVVVVFFSRFLCWPCESDAWPSMRCSLHDAMRRQSDQPLLLDSHNVGLFFSDGSPSGHVFLCQPLLWRPFQRSTMYQFQSRLGSLGAWIYIHLQIQAEVRSLPWAYGSERSQPLLDLGLAGYCYNQTFACLSVALSQPIGYSCWTLFFPLSAFGGSQGLVSNLWEHGLGLMECPIWCRWSGPPTGPWVVHPFWMKLIFLVTTSVEDVQEEGVEERVAMK